MYVRSLDPLSENALIVKAKGLLDKCRKLCKEMNDDDSKVLVCGQMAILHMIPDNIVYSMGEAESRLIECQKLLVHKDTEVKSPGKKSIGSPSRQSKVLKVEPRNKRVELDLLIMLAFVNFEWQEWKISENYFNQGYKVSKSCLV